MAAGGLLVASGLLSGSGLSVLLGCLAASYVLWGAGLWVSLDANWAMLSATGVSSNALSKAAHDLAKARGLSARRRRLAASAGYVLTEAAKELPYYASVSAATLVSSVSTGDALIFLAGTNIGAAAYEYGLACGTRFVLRRTCGVRVADREASASGRQLGLRRHSATAPKATPPLTAGYGQTTMAGDTAPSAHDRPPLD